MLAVTVQKRMSSVYELHIELLGNPIFEPSTHSSIAESIKEAGDNIPESLASFVNLYYGEVSSGTTAVADMSSQAELLAYKLVALTAAVAAGDG